MTQALVEDSIVSIPTVLPVTSVLAAEDEMMRNVMGHVVPYRLFEIGPIPFTNHMFMVLVSALAVLAVFRFTAGRVRTGPKSEGREAFTTDGPLAQFFEVICMFIRENVAKPQLGHLTDRYIGYIWTVFFFILFTNVIGIIPLGALAGTIAYTLGSEYPGWWAHWWGTATTNLAITSALAGLSLIAIIGIGVREQGTHYFAHFAPVPFKPLGMVPIAAVLVLLEVMGLVVKCVVLAMRLFGVMTGGHLVIGVLLGLIFLFQSYWVGIGVMFGALAISLLELFIGLLQAFIFTFLTTIFIAAGAVHGEHGEHDEHHEPEVAHAKAVAAHGPAGAAEVPG